MSLSAPDSAAAAPRPSPEPSVSLPDYMLETLVMAPLPSSCLRLVLYLLRRTRGPNAQGRAVSTVSVQTRALCRVLSLSASSVHEALDRLERLSIVTLVPGSGFDYGVSLNVDATAWGQGASGWGKLAVRRQFEEMLGSFTPEGDGVTPRAGSGSRPTINRKRKRRPPPA
jgi:hypothetical protein